jgi:hypothetical protein
MSRAPAAVSLRQRVDRRGQRRDVHVVPAGVHGRHGLPRRVHVGVPALVRQAGLLEDRQPVHVRPQQHGRPLAVAQQTDHAGAADPLGHLQAARPQLGRQGRRGAVLLPGQLGVRVQVAVEVAPVLGPRVGGVEQRGGAVGVGPVDRVGHVGGPSGSGCPRTGRNVLDTVPRQVRGGTACPTIDLSADRLSAGTAPRAGVEPSTGSDRVRRPQADRPEPPS